MFIKALFASVLMLFASYSVATAQTAASATDTLSAVLGKWTGTFDGSASGKFELMLNRDASQKLTGQIVMVTDDGTRHPLDLKTVTWQKNKLSAAYTDPSSGQDVSFSGNLTDPTLKGTWDAGGGQASGTWELTRAPK
ncbi:hypothetical protein ACFSUS_13020 [Spirosoma soli]|uniref:Uncharacterized protein n=1 Tax=Spirosoma soli TaxID=1770529 RepID=A0ABW5M5F3_9BACT